MPIFELNTKKLDLVTTELLNGLITDGGHHKQWHLENALKILPGSEFYDEAKDEFRWEDGIPS